MKSQRKIVNEYNRLLKACDMLYHSIAARLGISDCAFWILYTIQVTEDVCRQSDICEAVSMSRQTVNSALKKLEKAGYLTLSRIDGKMGKTIHLTDSGERFVVSNILPVMEAEERACAGFSETEKETFMGLYHTLVDRLTAELSEGGIDMDA